MYTYEDEADLITLCENRFNQEIARLKKPKAEARGRRDEYR